MTTVDLGNEQPPLMTLPGLSATARNVAEAYQVVWRTPTPAALLRARMLEKNMP